MEINGLFLIDKDENMTSRDVDNAIQKKFQTRKVGHLGTLDPFATGLLVVGINKGTKLLSYIEDNYKTYIAVLKLGNFTTSGDLTGEVKENLAVPVLTNNEINEVLQGFLGKSMQKPPVFSAKKINGKELYKYAHKNQTVDENIIKDVEIEIKNIKLLSFKDNEITFICDVSKGTYVRVLGEDIAKKLGTAGFLTKLRRISVGNYSLMNAKKLNELSENDLLNQKDIELIYPKIKVNEIMQTRLIQGKDIKLDCDLEHFIAVDNNDNLIAACEKIDTNLFKSLRGLF